MLQKLKINSAKKVVEEKLLSRRPKAIKTMQNIGVIIDAEVLQNLQLEEGKYFDWSELHERQKQSEFIRKSARHSSTFLDEVLETLVKARFLLKSDQKFALYPGFSDFEHVSFYSLGSYGKS